MSRHLILLRHADAEAARPGRRDIERQLSPAGLDQAAAAGRWLQERHRPDVVLCSPATRTRETLAELGVGAPAEFPDWLYDAGGETIVAGIRELDPSARTALVVGHAPGVPAALHELTDPETSDPEAVRQVASRFPAGTLAILRVDQDWAEVSWGALVAVRLPGDD